MNITTNHDALTTVPLLSEICLFVFVHNSGGARLHNLLTPLTGTCTPREDNNALYAYSNKVEGACISGSSSS